MIGPMAAEIRIVRGDLTKQDVDAVVNAANERMLGGGGVDGAIHRAAGPALREACEQVEEVRPGVRCPTGEARLTEGFELPAKYVIHTVGPRYARRDAERLLASAFRSSLELASARDDVRSVALPAVSCGVYGYPVEEAAEVARRVVEERGWDLDEIRFVLFGQSDHDAFARVFGRR
jgi:O-acetyl-ADP-ribose deacetylase (regulator of RNase III)